MSLLDLVLTGLASGLGTGVFVSVVNAITGRGE